jgi:hypothetical protein
VPFRGIIPGAQPAPTPPYHRAGSHRRHSAPRGVAAQPSVPVQQSIPVPGGLRYTTIRQGVSQVVDPARWRRRRPIVLPVAVAALLLITGGAVAVLYLAEVNRYAAAQKTVISQQNDLSRLRDDFYKANHALEGARNETEEVKRQKRVISTCLRLIDDAGTAAQRGDLADATAKAAEATPVCDEADKYLDPAATSSDSPSMAGLSVI